MKKYNLFNNVLGWLAFLISGFVYISTIEPTTSFWDCGEFISTSFKLEVGHPPGNPLFQIAGRFFSLFAGGDVTKVAVMINIMSALFSALTIMFLFWTITHFSRRYILKISNEMSQGQMFAIFGSGLVGAMAYTFTDSFWFSAVEGEVYGMSSLFTAAIFWAILKWENVAHEKYANRWLIIIAYLMGLSIGVHLLNLLAIPAIVLLYYFKKYPVSKWGIAKASILAIVLVGVLMWGIIPGIVILATKFERIFVNGFGMGFNSGIMVYAFLMLLLIVWGLWYTYKKKKVLLNTILLCFTVIMLGYSSYAMIVIRSFADTPINENEPENAFALLSYLNREQYGDRPLFYGHYYNAPIEEINDGDEVFIPKRVFDPVKNDSVDRYIVTDRKPEYVYNPQFTAFFPRMWSSEPQHIREYKKWTGDTDSRNPKGTPIIVNGYDGKADTLYRPSGTQNLRFFFTYQIWHMYMRYFMWNFVGRQNDVQGHGNVLNGNWLSGIPFIDAIFLGPQNNLPSSLTSNKARNTYYFLPLILGLLGMIFQFTREKKGFVVVALLFFFTGIAIVIYLNQYPLQPRERDYSFAGSFYAFAIWIGFGVMGLYNFFRKFGPEKIVAVGVTAISLILVPGIMAKENWDDHDRSHRYTARDFAKNYLDSCAPNAILFTNGDNDTFPLWYAQEVEGYRTDVRIINLSLLNTDWYVEQMKNKVYDSDPVPFSFTFDQICQGHRDLVRLFDIKTAFVTEKYLNKKHVYEPRYQQLYDAFLQIINASKFPAENKADYDVLAKGYKNLDLLRFGSLISKLAEKAMIDKFGLNEKNITDLNTATKNLLDAVSNEYLPLKTAMDFVKSEDPATKDLQSPYPDYIPTKKFSLPVDKKKVLENGTVSKEDADKIVSAVEWSIDKHLYKADLMILDLLNENKWERPVYFAITVGGEGYLSLEDYFQLEGLTYRLVPIKTENKDGQIGRVSTSIMYDNMMNKFHWGGIDNPDVYLDENNLRVTAYNLRGNFGRLAGALNAAGKKDSALKVLDRCDKLMSHETVPYNYFVLNLIEQYYKVGKPDKANKMSQKLFDVTSEDLNYYLSLDGIYFRSVDPETKRAIGILSELGRMTRSNKQDELAKKYDAKFKQYYDQYLAKAPLETFSEE